MERITEAHVRLATKIAAEITQGTALEREGLEIAGLVAAWVASSTHDPGAALELIGKCASDNLPVVVGYLEEIGAAGDNG